MGDGTGLWKAILKGKEKFNGFIRMQLGSGEDIHGRILGAVTSP